MDAYSNLLLAAWIVSPAALAASLAGRLGLARPTPSMARRLALLGGALALVSGSGHWFADHARGADPGLGPLEFAQAHPAPLVALCCAVSAALLARRGARGIAR